MQEFIRKNPVDLSQYVPSFLLEDDTFKHILEVESKEHDKERLELIDILKQFFVFSATWGLDKWESLLGLTPENEDTPTQRRLKIYTKLQGKQISTVAFLEKLCKKFMSDDSTVKIIEHNEKYMFQLIQSSGSILYFKEMLEAINMYKPAHLTFRILLKRLWKIDGADSVKYGFIDFTSKISSIGLARADNAECKTGIGFASGKMGKNHVNYSMVPNVSDTRKIGVGYVKSGFVHIETDL